MAAPTLLETYPNDGDTNLPTGISLYLIFDRGIDLSQAKKNVVLYGTDTDVTSGPDSAQWVNDGLGTNPFFLRSPGFKGVVDCDYSTIYVDADYEDLGVDPLSSAEELSEVYYHKLIITPRNPLAPDVSYKLQVIGDPSSQGTGISSRTVFALEGADTNVGTTGHVTAYGGYTGQDDTIWVEITTSGDIGEAEYKWWYESSSEASATLGKVTSRRYRKLEDGVQIKFEDTGFVSGDLYSCNVEESERLATSTTITFTTGDGSYTEAPDSPSTPATAEPPTSTLPADIDVVFDLVEVSPADGSSNLPLTTTTIELTFSTEIDPATVTQDSVRVQRYPVTGVYSGTNAPVELAKSLEVVDNVLTIRL